MDVMEIVDFIWNGDCLWGFLVAFRSLKFAYLDEFQDFFLNK